MTSEELQDFLFNPEKGFLIKYHFKKGIDMDQLDGLYDILERYKTEWKYKAEVPKAILFNLVTITPLLYKDLQLYMEDEVKSSHYEELIDNLDKAIQMCLNPDINDIHFNKRLKDLSF